MRADRLLDIVSILRRHDRVTAARLAEQLGVSRRTILRDLEVLSASGVPVYAEHGRAGGYALLPGYRPDRAGLTEEELTTLLTPGGLAAARALGREEAFRVASRKLEAFLGDSAVKDSGAQDQWLLHAPDGWGEPVEPPCFVTVLARAVTRRDIVNIVYRAPGKEATTRTVRPLGLVLAGSVWYLVAFKDGTGERRTYRVDRVAAVESTGRTFTTTARLADEWRHAHTDYRSRANRPIRLEAEQDAVHVVEYVISLVGRVTSVRAKADGTSEVCGAVGNLTIAARVMAGLGERTRILEPPELVREIVEISRATVERYDRDKPHSPRG